MSVVGQGEKDKHVTYIVTTYSSPPLNPMFIFLIPAVYYCSYLVFEGPEKEKPSAYIALYSSFPDPPIVNFTL